MTQKQKEASNFNIILSVLAPPKARKQKQLVLLQKILLKHPIFQKVLMRNGASAIREIASNLIIKNYQPDQIIYKLPEDLRTFNFIVTGLVHLYADTDSALQHRAAFLSRRDIGELNLYKRAYPNQYFGDKVFTTGRKFQIVCAKAIEPTMVLQLNLITLHKTFQGIFVFRELELIIQLLRNVAIFSKIPSKKIQKILQFSKRKKYSNGHTLFYEGECPGNLIVILQGEVTLKKKVQFSHEQDIVSRNFDLSILSKFDTMGIQEILQDRPYFSTAICTSDNIDVLEIQRDMAKMILSPYCLQRLLDKNKQKWRKRRVFQLQSSLSRRNISPILEKKQKKHSFSVEQIQFTIQDRHKLSYMEDKFRSSKKKKFIKQHRLSLPICKTNSNQKQSTLQGSTIVSQIRDHSHQLLQKYMVKKQKKQKIQIMKYAYSKTTEHGLNPENDSNVLKPLYVKKSQAIKNTMRQIKHSRKHIYNYMLRLTQSLN